MHRLSLVLIFAVLLAPLVFADDPLPPPSVVEAKSANGKYVAVSDPDTKTTTISSARGDTGKANVRLWDVSGWYRHLWLSDDGGVLVAGYDGFNLLPKSHAKDEVLLRFFALGNEAGKVTLDQVISDESHLKKTASHLEWGRYKGFDEQGHFVIETVEGKELVYDAVGGAHLLEKRDAKKK